jgi:hypothetical protein
MSAILNRKKSTPWSSLLFPTFPVLLLAGVGVTWQWATVLQVRYDMFEEQLCM